MKLSEFKNLIKEDSDNFAQNINVWGKIESEINAENEIITPKIAKKRIPLKAKLIAIFSSMGGSVLVAGVILLIVFLSNLSVLPSVDGDVRAAYAAVLAAENLAFTTSIDVEYGTSSANKTLSGNIEGKNAFYEVVETFHNNETSSELYTDGSKVYENNKLLDLKYITSWDAEQLYSYVYILAEFNQNDFLGMQTESINGNTVIYFRIVERSELDALLETINRIPEIDQFLTAGIIEEVLLTFELNESKELVCLGLNFQITVASKNMNIAMTIEFFDFYDIPIIEEPEDLDKYAQPSYEVSDALSVYNVAYNAMFEREDYSFSATKKWYNGGVLEDETKYNINSSGSGVSKVTYLKRARSSLTLNDSLNVELWINDGYEYKHSGELKIKSALSYNEQYQLAEYLPMIPSQTYTFGEIVSYEGKTYITLKANGERGEIWTSSGYSMLGYDNTLIMILDENEQIISLTYKASDTIGSAQYDTVLEYSFTSNLTEVTLPANIGEYVNKFETAYNHYSDVMTTFRAKNLYSFETTYTTGSDAYAGRYPVIVEIDKVAGIGSIKYEYTGNGWYYEYKTYGYVYNQWYDGTYLYSVVEESPYNVKEFCTFEEFMKIVDALSTVRGVDAFADYTITNFSSVHIDDMDGFTKGILFANLGDPKFTGLTECSLTYNDENGELSFLSVMTSQNSVAHYVTVINFREIDNVNMPSDFTGYIMI